MGTVIGGTVENSVVVWSKVVSTVMSDVAVVRYVETETRVVILNIVIYDV